MDIANDAFYLDADQSGQMLRRIRKGRVIAMTMSNDRAQGGASKSPQPHGHDGPESHGGHAGHDHSDHAHDGKEEPGHAEHDHAGHDHAGHVHAMPDNNRAFAVGVTLNLAMVAAEMVFGVLSNSVSLIADGAHNLSDVIGLLLAWGGAWLARRQTSASRTYGYRRASILAALGNAALLLLATGGIIWESIQRIGDPQPIAGVTVMIVAGIGILVNGGTALMFMKNSKEDLNVRGAFLHMASDAAVSVGVVLSTLLIMLTGWHVLDPLIGIAIAVVIVITTWQLAKDSVNMALDGVPANIDYVGIKAYLGGLPGVSEVHDLHVWALSTTETALTAHLVRPGTDLDDNFLVRTQQVLATRFRVQHVTLQVEAGDPAHPCPAAPESVV